MKIEVGCQPNCSELAINLGTNYVRNFSSFVKALRKENIKIIASVDGEKYENLDSKDIKWLVKKYCNCVSGNKNCDPLVDFVERAGKKLYPKDPNSVDVTIEGEIGEANLHIGDYCDDTIKGLQVQISDYEESNYPLLYKIEKRFNGKVHGVDGGHEDGYQEWKEGQK